MRHRPSIATATALLATGVIAAAAVPAGASPHPVRAALPPGAVQHVLVVDLENEGYGTTFGPGSSATYLNGTLRPMGVLIEHYYGIGHNSLDNYIAQVSGQSPTLTTQADCAVNGFVYTDVTPGTPAADRSMDPGQVSGAGCVYPVAVATIANQLDTRYPPNPTTKVAAWRGYDQDMGNNVTRDGGTPDATGGTDCAHPAIGAPDKAEVATAADQYTTRHNPFVYFHSVIDQAAECAANVVPLGTLAADGAPSPTGHLARDLSHVSSTPRFGVITPNLCGDGHDGTCAGSNSDGTAAGGLVGADDFLAHWMPLVLASPAYRSGHMMVVVTFDEAEGDATACCGEVAGPNTQAPGDAAATTDAAAPGGGQTGALVLDRRFIRAGSTDTIGSYNHYSALRSYEDLLGLTTGGTDGLGHLGYAAAPGLAPFGTDVFDAKR